mgnify:CR=1 FL=1
MAFCQESSMSVLRQLELVGVLGAPALSEPHIIPARVVALTVAIGIKSTVDKLRMQSNVTLVLRERNFGKWYVCVFCLYT